MRMESNSETIAWMHETMHVLEITGKYPVEDGSSSNPLVATRVRGGMGVPLKMMFCYRR